ncbi:DUF6445 family protein [Marinagarivorans cellulosilyticus]|uniref:Uncharacterized protein n=1 Tax=Marinagarivorans cellulosilyticus TaxID=2721545 RepID=A0AAN1WG50_9GAMM|nr:DUF6445 family protein [Marinagarivorans cellulosilyticus]BCD96983.1 hypothetical protein MARGE09_P1183 [Marinagarivorans cellulosilyticus]
MESIAYELCKDSSIKSFRVGNEQQDVLVVDNFLEGAESLKQVAVNGSNFSCSDSFYPGVRMPVPQAYIIAIVKNLGYFIENFFHLEVRKIKSVTSRFSIVTTPPHELELRQRIPHFDAPSRKGLAVVHYLQSFPSMGTALYRHKPTGFEYVDESRYLDYVNSINQRYPTEGDYPEGYINGPTDQFEEVISFDAVFNRLLMYRGTSLHSGKIGKDYSFDPNPATGRLTVTSFFEFN